MFDINPSQLLSSIPENSDVITFTIKVNNSIISDQFEVTQLSVHRKLNRISYAIIRLLNGDVSEQRLEVSDQDVLSPGNEVEIAVGYHSNEDVVFKGIIIKHGIKIKSNCSTELEIECKDVAVKMTVGRKSKYFFNKTDTDIFREITQDYNIDVEADDTEVEHPHMVQYHCTNWDFILTRADANALVVLPKDGRLILKKPDFDQQEQIVLNYGSSIYEFEAEMDARDQYPASKAVAWNPAEQSLKEAQANENGTNIFDQGSFPSVDSVASINSSIGDLVPNLLNGEPNTDYTQVLDLEHFAGQHSGVFSNEELQNWAAAQYQKSQLAKSKGRVRFEGVADIYPGNMINLQNVGARHNGKVYVTAVKHEIKDGAWFTEAQFGLPHCWFNEEFDNIQEQSAAGLLPGVNGLQIGLVTKIEDDPEGEDRILVRLPLVDIEAEGVWARVACQDAGSSDDEGGRGSYFRPDEDDEVIVGFLNDDPRNPIILGMLNSSQKTAPITATQENHEKGWVTRSGMRMIFNDEEKSLVIETPDGKKILVNDEQDAIQLEDQHGNSLKMNEDGIVIESSGKLDLKASGDVNIEGQNVKQSAQQEMSLEGNSKASISSSGDVVVKGTFVKIN